jgi:hypothetical protein
MVPAGRRTLMMSKVTKSFGTRYRHGEVLSQWKKTYAEKPDVVAIEAKTRSSSLLAIVTR